MLLSVGIAVFTLTGNVPLDYYGKINFVLLYLET